MEAKLIMKRIERILGWWEIFSQHENTHTILSTRENDNSNGDSNNDDDETQ